MKIPFTFLIGIVVFLSCKQASKQNVSERGMVLKVESKSVQRMKDALLHVSAAKILKTLQTKDLTKIKTRDGISFQLEDRDANGIIDELNNPLSYTLN